MLVRAYQTPGTDHAVHLAFVETLVAEGRILPHPAYHLLVGLAAGLRGDPARIASAAVQALTLLVLAKLALSVAYASDLARRAQQQFGHAAIFLVAIASFSLAPLPAPWRPGNPYLGQLSPMAWHSPTTIALLPPAIGAFWLLLRVRGTRSLATVALSVVLALSVAVKPNFALAFLPLLALLVLLRRLPLGAALACAAPTLALLAWQYVVWTRDGNSGGLAILPLVAWRIHSQQPALSTLLSLAFTAAVSLFAWRDLAHRAALLWAWLLAAIAIVELALLAEPGSRFAEFNYYWGSVPAVHILFLTALCELMVRRPLSATRRGFAWCCWVLLFLHAASGVYAYCHPFQLPGFHCAF